MIQNKHILKSLPLLAAALGKKYGVEVVIGGDNACTNGRSIYLPTLPLDCNATLLGLARGYIDHESAHLRETDFTILKAGQLTALEKHIWNILEDWRVEQKLAAVFPGCKQNLSWLIRHLFLNAPKDEEEQKDKGKQDKQETIPDAIRVLDWLLLTVRSWDVAELKPKCGELAVAIEADYPNLINQLNQILQAVPARCHNSQDCLIVAKEIVLTLFQYIEQTKIEQSGQSLPSDPKQSTPIPTNPNQNQASQNKPANPLQQLKNLTNSLTDELPQDIGSIVIQKLGKCQEVQRDGVVVATLGHKDLAILDEQTRLQAKSATNALRTRLQALLQSKQLVRDRIGYRGKLDTHKLHRISIGDARIFLGQNIRQGLNTAIHILLDSSGSMHGPQMDLACAACYSVAEALRIVPGVNLAVTAFPGDPSSSANSTAHNTVVPILKHGQKAHNQFMLSACGSTPMDAAIWWTLQ